MKKSAKKLLKSAPVIRYLREPNIFTDNKLDEAIDHIGFGRIMSKANFRKQKGDSLMQVMFATLIWPLLDVRSISNFCGKFLSVFINGGKNVLYDFLKRENLNWRKLRQSSAKKIYQLNDIQIEKVKAFVFDDTLKERRGKKVEATSTHFDHTTNRHIKGQQVLEMGLVSPKGYLPIDAQLYVGDENRTDKKIKFKNPLSAVAKDYQCARDLNKNQMLRQMIKRALRAGFKATYVLGDAWFGTKGNISSVIEKKLTGIFRMKSSTMKYRVNGSFYTAEAIYCVNRYHRENIKKQPWQTFSISVEINLEEKSNKKPKWTKVQLVFVTPKHQQKKEYALFLCTDLSLSIEKVLEIYSLRWTIEVYFKEVKQYMGFLKEQTGNYACHYASVHLSAIRYLLFSHMLMTEGDGFFGELRNRVSRNLELLSFASVH